ncbi:MAG: redox-regulated ATPase YchF [Thermodesulfobacteriota bacterium]|nr:redox-regulated ATPase YchF [Thermodesulfobacteriota bacterium]
MDLTFGIAGLPNTGKSTLFNLLTNAKVASDNYPFCTIDPNIGIVDIPDKNLDALADITQPDKITYTTLKFFDIAGLVKNAHQGEGLGNQFLGQIRGVDAICHVVRCFGDKNVSHVYNEINPVKDIEIILTELIMADLEIVEKKINSMEKGLRIGKKDMPEDQSRLLYAMKDALSHGIPIIETDLGTEDRTYMKSMGILSAKPYIIVANTGEDDIIQASEELESISSWGRKKGAPVIPVCGQFELEAMDLDADERQEFLESVGITQTGRDSLIRACYDILGLITFYTPVGKELKAWTIKKGKTLYEAAGQIHTDIQKGFIKAEVITLKDFVGYKGMHKARDAGLVLTEGRGFVLRDHDIIVIHFKG